MNRDTIIFVGSSNTFGLGLEIEFRPKYNDDNWLKENGINLPLPIEKEDRYYWKKYRWSKLVCDELGMVEHNAHDEIHNLTNEEPKGLLGGNAIETIWIMTRDKENVELKNLLNETKYIVLEIGYVRWWDENLHGSNDGKEYPNTIREMIALINNPKSDASVVAKSLEWLKNLDEDVYWNESFKKYIELKKDYPEIKFILFPWGGPNVPGLSKNLLNPLVKDDYIDIDDHYSSKFPYGSIQHYMFVNKLTVGDVAKAFNGNYKYNRKDDHAGSEGQKRIAKMVINHIKKLENEKQ
jgi:hypothetical protein